MSVPSVDRILEKGLTVLPKLRDPDARTTVAFYECLQQVSAAYLIPLIPFDAICLRNNYEGLFPPGLSTNAYAECCAAVLKVLPRLLPATNTKVGALISAVSNASRNGYDLLWRVLELYVPGFDPTVPIAHPHGLGTLLFWTSVSVTPLFPPPGKETGLLLPPGPHEHFPSGCGTFRIRRRGHYDHDERGYLPPSG